MGKVQEEGRTSSPTSATKPLVSLSVDLVPVCRLIDVAVGAESGLEDELLASQGREEVWSGDGSSSSRKSSRFAAISTYEENKSEL